MSRSPVRVRRGTIACLMAITCVVLVSFLALAIDIGMLATARTQAQHGADLAALCAARTVNGNPVGGYNVSAATVNAQNILTYNKILGNSITSSQLTLTYGSYDYNQTTQTFSPAFIRFMTSRTPHCRTRDFASFTRFRNRIPECP